jgi:hypothetical protein
MRMLILCKKTSFKTKILLDIFKISLYLGFITGF